MLTQIKFLFSSTQSRFSLIVKNAKISIRELNIVVCSTILKSDHELAQCIDFATNNELEKKIAILFDDANEKIANVVAKIFENVSNTMT